MPCCCIYYICGRTLEAQLTLSTVPSALGGRQAAPMGPTTEVASPPTATSAEVPQPLHAPAAPQGNDHLLGSGHGPRFADWLYRSSAPPASSGWPFAWCSVIGGPTWATRRSGAARKRSSGMGGAGVKGFATAGVVGSTAGKGGASYGWWAAVVAQLRRPERLVDRQIDRPR